MTFDDECPTALEIVQAKAANATCPYVLIDINDRKLGCETLTELLQELRNHPWSHFKLRDHDDDEWETAKMVCDLRDSLELATARGEA